MRAVRVGFSLLVCLLTLITMLLLMLFLGNMALPRTIDSQPVMQVSNALLTNLLLISAFALQHSGMARTGCKRRLRRIVSADFERGLYVLMSDFALLAVMLLWQPLGGVVWAVDGPAAMLLQGLYFCGWVQMAIASCQLDAAELLGVRQVLGRRDADVPRLRTPGMYRYVRHPIYLGWLVIFWAAPVMTVAHLVLAVGLSLYILAGIQLEERDLISTLPEYRQYRRKVPMLLPSVCKRLMRNGPAPTTENTRRA